ncbi:hypothetical protein O6H91_21G042500 [Diphasiastrum complanatum]|uniref:Uncharacterized protein n=1 Tax=Diphasiastrum complanatum TaxID=34168 RepID=A0ACC2AK55_DIPCM|nr:hypothetical protein O6H91_21G042500 [Diphasiastrum complanatum]
MTIERSAHLQAEPPQVVVPRIFNECQQSLATHRRGIKQLVKCRRSSGESFSKVFQECLLRVFVVNKREPSVERLVKLVASFAAYRDQEHAEESDAFLEELLGFLLRFADSSQKSVRFRVCQLVSEVMLLLGDDVELSDNLWDELTVGMHRRIRDKVPTVRFFAARALGRLVSPDDSGDFDTDTTVMQYRIALANDQNVDVRKMVVMSMPPSNSTIADIVERSADVNEVVRKVVFTVLGSKFPIQSLSIRQRTTVLKRGLNDRQPTVRAECVKMLIDAWLTRDCGGDPFTLLRYLDVETNESVGEAVLQQLLKGQLIKVEDSTGLNQFLSQSEGFQTKSVKLLEAEQAIFWRMVCGFLQSEAQVKGLEAASTGGAEALVNAADAAEKSELLEKLLPPTVAEYVELVNAHLVAGPSHRFVSRNLLMLAKLLDFSDAVNRRAAANLIQELLFEKALEAEQNVEIFRDGLHLGAEKEWATAVAELAQKVHGAVGELVQVIAEIVRELARPCREGGANAMQWLQCLAVTGLLLENLQSVRRLSGCSIDAQEIMDGVLIPAAKHIQMEVQQAGVRWLGLFCQLEDRPNMRALKQICLAARSGNFLVQHMALKALFDLILSHGVVVVDRSMQMVSDLRASPELNSSGVETSHVAENNTGQKENDEKREKNQPVLKFLAEMLDQKTIEEEVDHEISAERETRTSVVAEGFAKLLLQSKTCPEILDTQNLIIGKLVQLYFSEDTKFDIRLQQCLSVFFQAYASLGAANKRCVAKAFLPVLRSEWPGLTPSRSVSQGNVAARKKRATQMARFMLQLLKQKLLKVQETSDQTKHKDTTQQPADGTHNNEEEDGEDSRQTEGEEPDSGHEELAIIIATEVTRFPSKRSWAGKGYRELLCKVAASLHFRASQQEAIKCMRKLLDHMIDAMKGEKLICKELNAMVNRLKAMDKTPEEGLRDEQVQHLLDRLGIHVAENEETNPEPTQPSTTRTLRKVAAKRSQRVSATPDRIIQTPMPPPRTDRPQRTCKTETLQKIKSKIALESRAIKFDSTTTEDELDST